MKQRLLVNPRWNKSTSLSYVQSVHRFDHNFWLNFVDHSRIFTLNFNRFETRIWYPIEQEIVYKLIITFCNMWPKKGSNFILFNLICKIMYYCRRATGSFSILYNKKFLNNKKMNQPPLKIRCKYEYINVINYYLEIYFYGH